jgi:hypothetical protein
MQVFIYTHIHVYIYKYKYKYININIYIHIYIYKLIFMYEDDILTLQICFFSVNQLQSFPYYKILCKY